MTTVLTKPKAAKVERYDVDGRVVEVKRVPPDTTERHYRGYNEVTQRYDIDKVEFEPVQRSKYEVYVDGVLRGYIAYPLGYGGQWHALSLRVGRYNHSIQGVLSLNESIMPVNEHGYKKHEHRWGDRAEAARFFVTAIALGQAPTAEEVEAEIAERERAEAEQKAEAIRRQAQWEREREEEKVRAAAEAARREEERVETLEGLTSIRERFGGQLSNLETVALTRAIEQVTK